jgi:hypothetical protein
MQRTIQEIESIHRDQTVSSFDLDGESYRRNRRTANTIDTRFGPISYERWYFQNTQVRTPGIAPLDVRLGIVAGRMSPALDWPKGDGGSFGCPIKRRIGSSLFWARKKRGGGGQNQTHPFNNDHRPMDLAPF